jgi:hypothetical protein
MIVLHQKGWIIDYINSSKFKPNNLKESADAVLCKIPAQKNSF